MAKGYGGSILVETCRHFRWSSEGSIPKAATDYYKETNKHEYLEKNANQILYYVL